MTILTFRVRSLGIWWTAGLLNWVDDRIVANGPEIVWQDHLRWWLEDRIGAVFCFFYAGSDEELEAVYKQEVPLDAMSPRQLALLTPPFSQYTADCCRCGWTGYIDISREKVCPSCQSSVYIDCPFPEPEEKV